MSERQRLCFFVDGLQQWIATELRQNKSHNLASAMAIVKRLEDFEQRRHRHHKGEKKHEGSRKQGDSRDYKAYGGPREGCFYGADPHYRKDCQHKGKMIGFLKKHKGSKGDSSSSNGEAHIGALHMVNAFVQKSKEETAKKKKSKKRWGLLYATVDVAGKTQEVLVDTGAKHNFMSSRVVELLGLKPTKDGSWFMAVNTEERPTKGVIKRVNLRIDRWPWKANFNIIDMDELGVVLGIDFMEKSSITFNPYCGMMMMVGKEGQPECMILLVSKDGANAHKGITMLQLDEGLTLCYVEW
ncbi:hypothetical protein RJ639_002321 [Escallonia herrerae]|uniref:Uncharacterized protein n=1 Tax=Escallonia herrerae TaxID=1293975 RepID=A0AA89BGE2_9ASTE|nr:hypothetical protein RJ639_002321 [Escallonia herrerae]